MTQDDVLFPHLTVRETLVYAALLRLPTKTFTRAQKIERAEETIAELGLERYTAYLIGHASLPTVRSTNSKAPTISVNFWTSIDKRDRRLT